MQHLRPTSPSASVTEPIPDAADVRPADSGAARLERVVLQEQGRLARKRLRLRVLAIAGAIAVAAVVVVSVGVWAGRRYIPVLLAPPPPPKPLPNQLVPEAAKPAPKKKTSHRKHGAGSSAPAETIPAPADEAPPPSTSGTR